MLKLIYESAAGTLVDWGPYVRQTTLELVEAAEEATVSTSSVDVEDVGGALDIVGWKRWWAYETTCQAGNQIIACGNVGDREIGRQAASGDDQVLSADRWWSVGLVDAHNILSRRLITGEDGDRPSETDIERLNWLLSSDYLSGVSNALGYIDEGGPVQMDAADLRGQSAYQVISDCANASAKNTWLIPSSENPEVDGVTDWSLWYAYEWSANYTSSVKLTNIASEIDNVTVFAVEPDAMLRRSPERVYSGVLLRYHGGAVYEQRTATGNEYAFRDTAHQGINVRTASAASTKAQRYLADIAEEEDRITCSFTVSKEQVNDLRAGQRLQIKFSHLPGYSDAYSYARCIRRTVQQLSDDHYRLTVELTGYQSGVGTSTDALIRGPNDDEFPSSPFAGYIKWDGDGEVASPPGGCSLVNRAGLISYLGPSAQRDGFTVNGSGLLRIRCNGTVSGVGNGVVGFRLVIRRNGIDIPNVEDTQTTDGGLRALNWVWSLDVSDVVVRKGDEIEAYFVATGSVDICVVPAGTGDCNNFFRLTGTLW